MVRPLLESAPPRQCDDCKILNPPKKHKSGHPVWYRNQYKRTGFLCPSCYNRRYQRTSQKRENAKINTIIRKLKRQMHLLEDVRYIAVLEQAVVTLEEMKTR